MSVCNATLTTATVQSAPPGFGHPRNGTALLIDGKWVTVTLHTLTCGQEDPHEDLHWTSLGPLQGMEWVDGTPGSTPHHDKDA